MYKIKKRKMFIMYIFLFYNFPLILKKLKCFFSLSIILQKTNQTKTISLLTNKKQNVNPKHYRNPRNYL